MYNDCQKLAPRIFVYKEYEKRGILAYANSVVVEEVRGQQSFQIELAFALQMVFAVPAILRTLSQKHRHSGDYFSTELPNA
jgi:hypothetical protein